MADLYHFLKSRASVSGMVTGGLDIQARSYPPPHPAVYRGRDTFSNSLTASLKRSSSSSRLSAPTSKR